MGTSTQKINSPIENLCSFPERKRRLTADFKDAHERHWDDAEHLYSGMRLPNADQLYGLSAECGLKHLMSRFGMQVDPNTGSPADKKDRIHADGLWSRFEAYLSGHPQATGYVLGLPNPFSDWEISQRYFPRHYFNTSRTRAHKEGADEVRRLVGKALREGLI